MYEVELKFPLSDVASVVRDLGACGAREVQTVEQSDLYFNHPARDFEQTDEALRIRSVGNEHFVTYKGPVVDTQTKTRREIELALAGADAGAQFSEILRFLGFRPVRQVRKRRRLYALVWRDREIDVALDEVFGLDPFLEIETLADEASRPSANEAILDLAQRLRLAQPERRSYLALLIEKDREKKP
jgi:adenylate cyclase class 2